MVNGYVDLCDIFGICKYVHLACIVIVNQQMIYIFYLLLYNTIKLDCQVHILII